MFVPLWHIGKEATAQSEYQGQTYYFCSTGCKKAFDKDPAKYVGTQHEHSSHHHHN
ncbi:MAG: YHS domain-containing protein [Anaerolineae bacterium]|nr:YHS domain-containing protein [Anaerolineae bacterium]